MKKRLKSIVQIWNDFEQSPDREQLAPQTSSEIHAYQDGQKVRCVASCTPELAGHTIAFLLRTFTDTPSNTSRMIRSACESLPDRKSQ
ncbi:hypothetical protein [Ethanoligenens harbinense]|uniref:Uncharacterized protein n=1 Tax=Ethanoligenens harbinense (strain DSM 18485 / JCM 12961 / CGMCC 1.5033 / YUAN-3) TaxID=663278 RepID=E6U5A8_ETHHY|nr:hypothetical protein [Ethanoligenens harbinense]ADU27921.1 hypothetical protein Ethha_2425 [Ethanoligenens harbinense YUAN-3]AVQ96949.1 hypothetical protein CXQ68_12460 [Ethanoligenens harbinense YUAN-3]AYF39609.1 hypothetical protein CXP51_12355 [Ethanoligenens harbinense]AYF42437.1 hypothetical protein CN246_12910 [Ethanoligenens harbinense]QCN93190.1 hypothetical protein DRA42_12505 [Ethanoligenens harbinense]